MAYTVKLHHPEAAGGTYALTEPNSSTAVVGYADYNANIPLPIASQTLTATLGRATFFVIQVVEIVVKDADGVEVDRWVEGMRAELIELVNPDGFSGANVNAALADAFLSVGGPDFKYLPVNGASARLIKDVISERFVSAADIVGPNGETLINDGGGDNQPVFQAWIDALAAQGGGVGLLPAGLFALNSLIKISTPNITIIGSGNVNSVLLDTDPGGIVFDIDMGVINVANVTMRDFSITHTTTSTNRGIFAQNGGNVNFFDLIVDRHNRGIDMVGPDFDVRAHRCVVNETNGVAGGQGFILGADSRTIDCIASAVNGTGFALSEPYAQAIRCIVPTTTSTGYDFLAANTTAVRCRAENCTVGFELGTIAFRSGPIDCKTSGNTIDFATSGAAREVTEFGNDFASFSLGEVSGHWGYDGRCEVLKQFRHDTTLAGQNVDTDPARASVWVIVSTHAVGDIFVQTNAVNGVIDGQEHTIIVQNQSAVHNPALTFSAQWIDPLTAAPVFQNRVFYNMFRFRASDQTWVSVRKGVASGTDDTGPNW